MQQTIDPGTPNALCFRCGCPLHTHEIAMLLQGQMIKFESREVGGTAFYVCKPCMDTIDLYVKGGVRGAMARLQEANRMDELNKGTLEEGEPASA